MEAKSGYMLVNIKAAKAKASLMNFLEAHGMSAKELTADEAEDLGLLMMMLGVDHTKKVSRDTIMRKLKVDAPRPISKLLQGHRPNS